MSVRVGWCILGVVCQEVEHQWVGGMSVGCVAHFMGSGISLRGALTLVLTWLIASREVASKGGGGKPKISSSVNHGLLHCYFAPFSKAAK